MDESAVEESAGTLHPVVRRAADGALPGWARTDPERRTHMARVARLLERWVRERGGEDEEALRWRAAAFLHDALRDAPPGELRATLDGELGGWPATLLHGPAAARRLRSEGVEDEELLRAVAYHTVGHPDFGALGMALYCADFLDPGRRFRPEWRADLRARLPDDLEGVTLEVAAARIGHLLDERRALHPATSAFWNRLVAARTPERAGSSEAERPSAAEG